MHALHDFDLFGRGLLRHGFHGSCIPVSDCSVRQSIQAARGSYSGPVAGVHFAHESWKSGR
eukprot:3858572-Rhodomonas_salina.1